MTEKELYKKMYLQLFNRVTDALTALERQDADRAANILYTAQQTCEQLYIDNDLTPYCKI